MKKMFRSFRLRIFLLFVLVVILTALTMRLSIIKSYGNRAIEVKTAEVTNQLNNLANYMIDNNYFEDNRSELIASELSLLSSIYSGRVLVVNADYIVVEDTYNINVGKYLIANEVLRCTAGEDLVIVDENNRFIEILKPIVKDDNVLGIIMLNASLDGIDKTKMALSHSAGTMGVVVACVAIAISAILAFFLTKPFTNITKAIRGVSSYDDQGIAAFEFTETQEIAEAFNELQSRLKVMDDSRQDFVSNVSHELKTPITSIKVLADSLNSQEDVPVEVYRDFMQDITQEIDRENNIITDLLALVKMEKGGSVLNIESINVNEMLELVIKRLGPIARQNEIDIIFESKREVRADMDEARMIQAFTNLIENGIKYNRNQGFVKVVLDADHQFANIDIIDSGIGIPEEAIDHIFERFYRVDKSHSREIGGTGLGLAITRKTILLHRGAIKVNSVLDEGTTFSVRIPLSYIEAY